MLIDMVRVGVRVAGCDLDVVQIVVCWMLEGMWTLVLEDLVVQGVSEVIFDFNFLFGVDDVECVLEVFVLG